MVDNSSVYSFWGRKRIEVVTRLIPLFRPNLGHHAFSGIGSRNLLTERKIALVNVNFKISASHDRKRGLSENSFSNQAEKKRGKRKKAKDLFAC